MAFIRTVPESEATGTLRALYQKTREHMGYVPNHTRVFSLRPDVVLAWRNLLGAITANMDHRRYELVTLAAAPRPEVELLQSRARQCAARQPLQRRAGGAPGARRSRRDPQRRRRGDDALRGEGDAAAARDRPRGHRRTAPARLQRRGGARHRAGGQRPQLLLPGAGRVGGGTRRDLRGLAGPASGRRSRWAGRSRLPTPNRNERGPAPPRLPASPDPWQPSGNPVVIACGSAPFPLRSGAACHSVPGLRGYGPGTLSPWQPAGNPLERQ